MSRWQAQVDKVARWPWKKKAGARFRGRRSLTQLLLNYYCLIGGAPGSV
jgi:hypothetical protein